MCLVVLFGVRKHLRYMVRKNSTALLNRKTLFIDFLPDSLEFT